MSYVLSTEELKEEMKRLTKEKEDYYRERELFLTIACSYFDAFQMVEVETKKYIYKYDDSESEIMRLDRNSGKYESVDDLDKENKIMSSFDIEVGLRSIIGNEYDK